MELQSNPYKIMGKISFAVGLVTLMVGCATASQRTQVAAPAVETQSTARSNVQEGASSSRSVEERARAAGVADAQAPLSGPVHDGGDAPRVEAPAVVSVLPTTCANRKECIPPEEFARAACHGRYPSMAIAMFEKHTPWQRLYLKAVTLEAVNAYGDRSTTAPMVFGEEVIVLRGVSPMHSGKLQVSSSDIDVLRWDGTCTTVARELFSATPMPNMVQPIEWRYLEDSFQEALLKSKYVAITHERQHSACNGSADATKCRKATERLNEAIGVAVRGGIVLPTPEKLPKWATADMDAPVSLR
jgi:hypothetical protein